LVADGCAGAAGVHRHWLEPQSGAGHHPVCSPHRHLDCADIFLYHSSSAVVPLRLSQAGFGRADCLAALNATGNETLALYHLFDCTDLRCASRLVLLCSLSHFFCSACVGRGQSASQGGDGGEAGDRRTSGLHARRIEGAPGRGADGAGIHLRRGLHQEVRYSAHHQGIVIEFLVTPLPLHTTHTRTHYTTTIAYHTHTHTHTHTQLPSIETLTGDTMLEVHIPDSSPYPLQPPYLICSNPYALRPLFSPQSTSWAMQ
jgi:hypothetical protein